MNIKTSHRPYHGQKDAERFAVDFIKSRGMVSQSVLEEMYEDYLRVVEKHYDKYFGADFELVCDDSKERKNKCLENLSNHGNYEIFHDIVTINVREANRLGYRAPTGLKFKEKWYMTRDYAEAKGYPVHDTASWDKNSTKLKNILF